MNDNTVSQTPTTPERDALWDTIVQLVGSMELSVLLINHMTKEPDDPRPPSMASADDRAYRDEQQKVGNPKWADLKAPRGVHLATRDLDRLRTYVDEYRKRFKGDDPNIAVRVDPERVVVLDADNAEGVELVRERWGLEPTVLSPGAKVAGKWIHKGGAHFWLRVGSTPLPREFPAITLDDPRGPLPEDADEALKREAGLRAVDLVVRDRYVLVPPSRRAEGTYEWGEGGLQDMPRQVKHELLDKSAKREEERERREALRAEREASGEVSDLDQWSADTDWDEVLGSLHWIDAGRRDSCGCAIWTAPGGRAHPKSATAHDDGCTSSSTDCTYGGPLHVWTTGCPEGMEAVWRGAGRYTKAQVVASASGKPFGDWCREQGFGMPSDGGDVSRMILGDAPTAVPAAPAGDDEDDTVAPVVPLRAVPDVDRDNDESEDGVESLADDLTDEEREFLDAVAAKKRAMVTAVTYTPVADPRDEPTTSRVVKGAPIPAVVWQAASPEQREDMVAVWQLIVERGFKPDDTELYPRGFHSSPELLRAICDYSDRTRAVFHAARDRGAHPVALLLLAVTRTLLAAPVDMLSDELGSASLMTAHIGKSGTGKGLSGKARHLPWGETDQKIFWADRGWTVPDVSASEKELGSGQVAVDLLMEEFETPEGEKDWRMKPHPIAHIVCDEMTSLMKLGTQGGATHLETLMSAYSGARLGNSARSVGTKRRTTGPYTMAFTGGIQPAMSEKLLKSEDSGLVNRMFLAAVTDPYAVVGAPVLPDPRKQFAFPAPPDVKLPKGWKGVIWCPAVKLADMADDARRKVDAMGADDHTSQLHLARKRLAVGIALMHGGWEVTEEIWAVTGFIMEYVARSRAYCEAALKMGMDETDILEGVRQGNRDIGREGAKDVLLAERLESTKGFVKKAGAKGVYQSRIAARWSGKPEVKAVHLKAVLSKLATIEGFTVEGSKVKYVGPWKPNQGAAKSS